MVILIPARGGSQRIPNKALRPLAGKPLIDWTIESCFQIVGVYPTEIVVASDDPRILRHAAQKVNVWERPQWTATADAPDLTWLMLACEKYPDQELFVIRRPTSPFLAAETVGRALADFAHELAGLVELEEP